ncbi:MAG: diheme cytochrome c, partial [Chromatiales bacterium]|nr:diheme cytochrome c [Chromatiales bacterium]
NDVYARECGSCHMAYPPGLLPARSWERVMRELPSHFGDDASLPAEAVREITAYLQANASDRVVSRTGTKIGDSIGSGKAPLRISETRYFQRKHNEVPRIMVAENPQVKSFANCTACHREADKGVFDEHDARIPGFEWVRF